MLQYRLVQIVFSRRTLGKLVTRSGKIARKKASEKFKGESNISGAKEMMNQILSTHEAKADYYGIKSDDSVDLMKKQYEIIYNSLCKPIIRMESACYIVAGERLKENLSTLI